MVAITHLGVVMTTLHLVAVWPEGRRIYDSLGHVSVNIDDSTLGDSFIPVDQPVVKKDH